ncbi:hypothetical protein BOX15_Mlig026004g5 [Macrostomum lignano]|uniref:Cystinosin n=1 Tax=Macrostomum lignano TaxID=282301 RepID=A0A267DTC9_9PLAT|nr:hypothetical protein BOX15_Mlig026004g5 [Macrostomum lignano]
MLASKSGIIITFFLVILAAQSMMVTPTTTTGGTTVEEELFQTIDETEPITVTFSQTDVVIEVGEQAHLFFQLSGQFSNSTKDDYLYFTYQVEAGEAITSKQRVPVIGDLARVWLPSTNETYHAMPFVIVGLTPGHLIIGLNCTNPEFENRPDRFVRIQVIRSRWINVINFTVGLLYVFCWSASYYPQTWLNYTRKSVVGLNFDFVGFNIMGFIVYSIFNVGLYWVPPLQVMYHQQHPRGVIPVQLADCIFALHCFGITIFQGIQCFIYERGGQKLSIIGSLLLGGMASFLLICLILTAACGATCGLTWLQFIYFASYLKLLITLVKYVPQAYMNYSRKSTWGWSIGQVYLDFSGGFLSIAQMLLLAYNYNDWDSLLGDPTKLGLGIVSIFYNILFFMQHYCFYGPSTGGIIVIDGGSVTHSDARVNSNSNAYQMEKSTDEKTRLL